MDKRLDAEIADLARSFGEIENKTVKTLMDVDKRVKQGHEKQTKAIENLERRL